MNYTTRYDEMIDLACAAHDVMSGVLIHQRHRWGIMLGHERQYEGWWKVEIAMALESWCWMRDNQLNKQFGIMAEAKPKNFEFRSDETIKKIGDVAADILIAPWSDEDNKISLIETPRIWIELKTRATWWGESKGSVAKAFGESNGGLKHDIKKWHSFQEVGNGVIVCHITSHKGSWNDTLPETWKAELDDITNKYGLVPPITVGFPIPDKGKEKYYWTRMDCFLVSP
jgi:hypothetical protein